MDLRYIVPVAVLVGAAFFLAFGSDGASGNERSTSKNTKSEEAVPRSSKAGGGSSKGRRVVSKRVLRDRSSESVTESGLRYEVLTEGQGDHPGPTSKVKVHYTGTLDDGTVFDSSRERGQPAVFVLNQVIKGWWEGLQLMKPGAVYRFVIPPELAYGDRAAGSSIPAGSTLTFEVELISIEKP